MRRSAHGMPRAEEPETVQLQLSRMREEGDMLRMSSLSFGDAATASLLFPEQCRADLRPQLRAVRPTGPGRRGVNGIALRRAVDCLARRQPGHARRARSPETRDKWTASPFYGATGVRNLLLHLQQKVAASRSCRSHTGSTASEGLSHFRRAEFPRGPDITDSRELVPPASRATAVAG